MSFIFSNFVIMFDVLINEFIFSFIFFSLFLLLKNFSLGILSYNLLMLFNCVSSSFISSSKFNISFSKSKDIIIFLTIYF